WRVGSCRRNRRFARSVAVASRLRGSACRPCGGGTVWYQRGALPARSDAWLRDRKSTRLNSSHGSISYAVFCLKKKNKDRHKILFTAELDGADGHTVRGAAWYEAAGPGMLVTTDDADEPVDDPINVVALQQHNI